jgi:ribosomal protein L11 methyltransferase
MKRANGISSTVSKTCLARPYPALDIDGGVYDRLAALLDDFAPTAIEERGPVLRVFFATAESRDAARAALGRHLAATAVEVSDEDWARRSQEHLEPITVGRITIVPTADPPLPTPVRTPGLRVVIQPSMGFGTGHHATTRLCLVALQAIDLAGRTVLDVGTGSGILAIAAVRLGAASATGIDIDEDAIRSACENLTLNPEVERVRFEVTDLTAMSVPRSDVVVANLTAWLLARSATILAEAVPAGGLLITSGFHANEHDTVTGAFKNVEVVWQGEEQSWTALAMKKL